MRERAAFYTASMPLHFLTSVPCDAVTVVSSNCVQNEEAHIDRAIQSVHVPGADIQPEIIVVDAGSTDNTCSIASRHARVKILQVPGGRGAQLNEGLPPT